MKLSCYTIALLLLLGPVAHPDTTETESSKQVEPVVLEDSPILDSTEVSSDTLIAEQLVDTIVRIPKLDFAGINLFDALTALARAYNLSLYVDPSVTGNITLRLDNVLLNDALLFILKENQLAWEKTGDIIKIFKPSPPLPEPVPLDITFDGELLSVNLKNVGLTRLVDTLIDLTGRNIVLEGKVIGSVSGKLTNLPLTQALKTLLTSNGYAIRTVDEIIYVGLDESAKPSGIMSRNLQVDCTENLVSVDISDSKLADVIASVANECDIGISLQAKLEGNTTARFEKQEIENALTYLLLNSSYTFKEQAGIFFIGARDSEDLHVTKLILFKHLIASTVEPLIPISLAKQVAIRVIKEHNGLLLTGARTSIARVEAFIEEVDVPTAQVLFEVLVVDYSTTDRAEFSLIANNFGGDSGQPSETYYPELDVNWVGQDVNNLLRSFERRMSWSNLGVLPSDFFVRLRMLQQEGKANLRSHPQLATLNGHTASLEIGVTQYYLLESETVYPSQQSSISTQTSQRFETIKADLSLEITPHVNRTGELTVEIKPEFSTPVGTFDPDIPPTINTRVLNSTVRLKDGETIVLGGLVQTTESVNISRFPILGSLPLIGRLFQNRSSTEVQAELMIYVTPHVYYGSDGAIDIDTLVTHQ